jgi:hypothetical protein
MDIYPRESFYGRNYVRMVVVKNGNKNKKLCEKVIESILASDAKVIKR